MSDIATRLKCALGDTGITQKELAQMTGLTEVSISRYVNGSRVPKATTLARIADALGVGMGYFFDSVDKDTNVPSTDCISRQAALDALKRDEAYDKDIPNRADGVRDAIITIMGLPTAQPERTCVNCGRTINNGGWYADGRTRCPIEEHYALPKDGYCHLWEKRNVTDDDYPERREG